jgi:hypothetical protein
MLLALRLYDKAFEPKFLEASSDFFRAEGGRLILDLAVSRDALRGHDRFSLELAARESQRFSSSLTPSTIKQPGLYLAHASKRLREEQDRIRLYLDESTHRPLIGIVENHLLSEHLDTILSSGEALALFPFFCTSLFSSCKRKALQTCLMCTLTTHGLRTTSRPTGFPVMLERLELDNIKLLGQLAVRIGSTPKMRNAFVEAIKVSWSCWCTSHGLKRPRSICPSGNRLPIWSPSPFWLYPFRRKAQSTS